MAKKTSVPTLQDRFPDENTQTRKLSAWSLLARQKLPPAAGHHRPSPKSGRRIEKMLTPKKPKVSSTQRFLRHKTLPGHEHHGSVQRVLKEGTNRIVSFRDGTETRFTKPELKVKFYAALDKKGYKTAVQSIRVDEKTGRVKAMIGGAKQGVEREYQSVARANAAIKRIYKQA